MSPFANSLLLLRQLLRIRLLLPLELGDICRWWEIFRSDTTLHEELSDSLVTFGMFFCDLPFSLEGFFLSDIMIRHFCGEVLSLEEDRREEVSQRSIFTHTEFLLHRLSRVSSEEYGIALAADTSDPHTIDAALERESSELFLGLCQLLSDLDPLMIEELLLDELLLACLHSEVCLSEGNLLLARITVLCDQICRIAREMYVKHLSFRCLTSRDHLVDANEMIEFTIPCFFAGLHSLLYDDLEIPPILIRKKSLEISGTPVLRSIC